jgi:signal transduction histidine kinase
VDTWQPEPKVDWDLVPSEDRPSEYKHQRLRHLERVRRVVDLVRRHEYVVILGPAYSDKTHLMHDVNAKLADGEHFTPVYINLWRVRNDDEAAFFSSLAQTILRSETISGLANADSGVTEPVFDALSFRLFLDNLLRHHDRHLVLLIDHLQSLPHDLTHRLLQLLRAAYMERHASALHLLDIVVAGSAVLAELSHDATSPFNMAHAVFQGPLNSEASLGLVKANLECYGVPSSAHTPDRLLHWAEGDSYLLPLLVARCQQKVVGYEKQRITQTVVDQAVRDYLIDAHLTTPIREAIQAIEEDPDTMLDVVTLLNRQTLPRNLAHQQIFRTGVDRLQLSGAVCLEGDEYRIKNELFRQALRRHFVHARVAHVLRMNGRWQEAITYLSRQAGDADPARSFALNAPAFKPPAHDENGGRTDLLEAIIQSIYSANREQEAYRRLLDGIRLGFNLSEVRIYRVYAGRSELQLVGSAPEDAAAAKGPDMPQVIDLNDASQAEVRTVRGGRWELRGDLGSRRLLAPLMPERRAIGVVIIEHYSTEVEPHGNPVYHGELLRFLRHASSAIENVVMRSAIQEIGRAVLSAGTVNARLEQVLQTVLNAVGSEAGVLYLLDHEQTRLLREAQTGDATIVRSVGEASIDLAMAAHPAVVALTSRSFSPVRQSVPPELGAYLPLAAGGEQLGVLALFFTAARQSGFSQEDRKMLSTFADQVAIAVYNQRLLSRTNEALQEQVRQSEAMRRREEQMRSQELHDVINAVVHRGSEAGDVGLYLALIRDTFAVDNSVVLDALEHVGIRFRRLMDLVTPLEEITNLAGIKMRPFELAALVQRAVDELLPKDDRLHVITEMEDGLIVDGNPNLLHDALRSILDNGREAMPGGGVLAVRVSLEGDGRAAVRIRDEGQGISEVYKMRMFEPGFSTKPPRDAHYSRGRGLFTCRAIVHKHGGEIAVDSQQGVGTEVTILLPVLRMQR